MKEINKYSTSIICTIIVCVTVIIVFFSPYHYSMYAGQQPVRDNWITGKTEVLTPDGWLRVYPVLDKVRTGDVLKNGKIIKRAAP